VRGNSIGRRIPAFALANRAGVPLFAETACRYRSRVPVPDTETERIRRIYDRRSATSAAPKGDANLRWLCGQAQGETLEVGIGRGRTLPFYPPGIHLSAIELSGVALETTRRRAVELGIHITLHQGDAASLPYPDDHFDTVVFSFALCTIPDDRTAVAEAVRVLCPGGRLLLVEHVRSPNVIVRALERLFEPIELRRMGDHLLREPLNHVLAEGLEVERLERSWLGVVERLAARKPEADELEEAV
jgi:SAM-dependent methyltransferase